MPEHPFETLFLCTHNSARSIMAEAILNRVGAGRVGAGQVGAGRFRAHSAGSQPSGRINPDVLALLCRLGYPTADLRSKDWAEYARPGAPRLDFVITVCDQAAGEPCPVWPGQPMTAHWGFADPSGFTGSAVEVALKIAEVFRQIERRVTLFASLPFAALDRISLQRRLDAIGQDRHTTSDTAA